MADAPTANAYLRTKVLSASPAELRLMLLDGAIKFATQGRDGLERKDYAVSLAGFQQCRAILIELITTIKREPNPELADRVKALYTFMFSELVEANFEKDIARINKVIELLEFERETWRLLMDKLAQEQGQAAAGSDAVAAAAMPAARRGTPTSYTMPGSGRGLSFSA